MKTSRPHSKTLGSNIAPGPPRSLGISGCPTILGPSGPSEPPEPSRPSSSPGSPEPSRPFGPSGTQTLFIPFYVSKNCSSTFLNFAQSLEHFFFMVVGHYNFLNKIPGLQNNTMDFLIT